MYLIDRKWTDLAAGHQAVQALQARLETEFGRAVQVGQKQKFRKEVTKTFDKAEFMFPIKCDVHPWMFAWVSVFDSPYFCVSDKDGKFIIKKIIPENGKEMIYKN